MGFAERILWAWFLVGHLLAGAPAVAGHGHPMGSSTPLGADELTAACFADLKDLGLSEEALQKIRARREQLRKEVADIRAEIHKLRSELRQILQDRDFDLTRAQKLVGEISVKESEIRVAHTDFLHDLAHELTDAQWKTLLNRAVTNCGACPEHSHTSGRPCCQKSPSSGPCGAK